MPLDQWSLDGSISDFETIDAAGIPLDDSTFTGLRLSFSSDTATPTVIPQRSEVTSSTPCPQTPGSCESALLDLHDVPETDLSACLDQLCTVLRTQYPNSKPPGQLFKHFISRRRDLNHCKLCNKALENREQMYQHVMKVHCNHFPFACDELGW